MQLLHEVTEEKSNFCYKSGGLLSQTVVGKEHVIEYKSQKLLHVESNFTATEKENRWHWMCETFPAVCRRREIHRYNGTLGIAMFEEHEKHD